MDIVTAMINVSTEVLLEKLDETLQGGSVHKIKYMIDILIAKVLQDPVLCKWITEPVNISKIHNRLEELGVDPRSMQLKTRMPNRQKRAHLFLMAIKSGLSKIDE